MPSEIQTGVGFVVVSFVLLAALYDVEVSAVARRLHPRAYRWRRTLNWFPCGVAYAMFYYSRYNVSSGNIPSVQAQLGLPASAFAMVLSCGFWTYGGTAVFTGRHADVLGGRVGFLVACAGAAMCNLLLGLCFTHGLPAAVQLPVFASLYSLNLLLQGYGTSGIVKVNAAWYSAEERGVFSGVFNIMLTSGYYFSLGTSETVITELGWPFVFFIPGGVLAVFFLVIYLLLAQSPNDASWGVSHLSNPDRPSVELTTTATATTAVTATASAEVSEATALAPKAAAQEATAARNATSECTAALLRDPVFLCYLGALFALCWVRDGSINWYLAFIDTVQPGDIDADTTALVGGAITVGGFVGGLVCGWLSDIVFGGNRIKPLLVFSVINVFAMAMLYQFTPTAGPLATAFCVFANMTLVLGNYTVLSYAIPQDLPAPVVGTATGIMTAASYMASGLSGSGMRAVINQFGYQGWYYAVMLGLVLQIALVALAGRNASLGTRDQQTPTAGAGGCGSGSGKYSYTAVGNGQ